MIENKNLSGCHINNQKQQNQINMEDNTGENFISHRTFNINHKEHKQIITKMKENTTEENVMRTYNISHKEHKHINMMKENTVGENFILNRTGNIINHKEDKQINMIKENIVGENITLDRTGNIINRKEDKQITVNPQNSIDQTWQKITTGKPPRNIPGIYFIGIQLCYLFVPLYLGRSNDIRRRLNQHMQPSQRGKQRIDNFIQNQIKKSIMVKWIYDHNQKTNEGMYLNYIENHLGFKLIFNMKAGDGAARFRRPRSCLFRPTTTKIRPFPSYQRRLKARIAITLTDVQLARQIRGLTCNII